MIVVGGRDPGTNVSQPPANYSAFDNVTLYDPYIDVWYAQKASGDIPASREEFCAVTVRGDNGTYEMLVMIDSRPGPLPSFDSQQIHIRRTKRIDVRSLRRRLCLNYPRFRLVQSS